MWKPTRTEIVIAACASVAAFFLGGAVAVDHTAFGQAVAAWVQAIGAVGAIGWAVREGIAAERRRAAADAQKERDRKDERMNYLVLLVNLATKIVERMDAHLANVEGQNLTAISTRPLVVFKERLEAIPLVTLPSGGGPLQLVFVITFLDHFIVEIRRWVQLAGGDAEIAIPLNREAVNRLKASPVSEELRQMRAATHACLVTLIRIMMQIQQERDDVEKEIDATLTAINLPR